MSHLTAARSKKPKFRPCGLALSRVISICRPACAAWESSATWTSVTDSGSAGRTHAVLGLQGLAPYWFEVDGAAFLSTDGDLTARGEAEYDLHLTQRLVLQPRAEVEFSAQDVPERELGSGLTGLDAGVRLRYDIRREFGPYVGIEWQSAFGETRDIVEAAGGEGDEVVFLVGLRTWY